ncbi:hypothetical protein QEG98_28235 [Myxococcus sp. MxC21-1]|uniref:hypothetical protein n=1 Tax=Myxococcus sp. MxC21-1 TaxID=3041439 RepID=UPI00292E54A7|nr:hypothetical protein [Myxococcus sp. MxC21-1]WNZ59895.1 hypothetical protein QEG98_28235 [Myxococcus sp. MxC21-1]
MSTHWITKPTHDLPLTLSIGSDFHLGTGIILNDPINPRRAPIAAFNNITQPTPAPHSTTTPDITNTSTQFFESSSNHEEARILNIYFRTSLGFGSAGAAYDYASRQRKMSRTMYAIIEWIGNGDSIELTNPPQWNTPPNSESIADEIDRLNQFTQDYGTHYISTLNYGFRIAVRGSITSLEQQKRIAFETAFRALAVRGSLSGEQTDLLRSTTVDVRCEITAGGITPPHPLILTGFERVHSFLTSLSTGSIGITKGPVSAKITSYWHTLISFPKTRALLRPDQPPVISSPNGVPRGTIIAWHPTQSDQALLASSNNAPVTNDLNNLAMEPFPLIIPDGWALCDGTNGTPDLIERLPLGTRSSDDVGTTGGEATHDHYIDLTTTPGGGEGRHGGGGPYLSEKSHNHKVNGYTLKAPSMPPFTRVFFLMKL